MISREEYLRLKAANDAYEAARRGFDPKRYQRGGGYTPADEAVIAKAAGLTKGPSNDDRSKIELYEFVHQPPEKYFAYYDKDLTNIHNWMGVKLGDIVSKGTVYKVGFGNKGRAVNVRIRAINGKTYAGTCYLDAGNYCRMKAVKGTRSNPGGVRKNIFVFNNSPSGPADETAARELELYIDNDRTLYFQHFIPIVKNLMLKRRKGVYNRELAVKLFMYLMDAGAKKYVREFGTAGQKIDAMFNKNTRLLAARAFRDSFENEAELGNYDRLIGPVSNPRGVRRNIFTFNNSGKSTTRRVRTFYCHCGRRIELEGGDVECPKCGQWYNAFGQKLKDPSQWSGSRDYEDTLDNPRKLNAMEQAAAAVGLVIGTWAPGDGVTRYRFFLSDGKSRYGDYHQGNAVYTAHGRKDAMAFIAAYGKGRSSKRNPPSKSVRSYPVPRGLEAQVASMLRNAFIWAQAQDGSVLTVAQPMIVKTAIIYVKKHGWPTKRNPLTRREAGQELMFAREAFARAADLQRAGKSPSMDLGYAQGIAGVVGRRGTRAAARTAERVTRHLRYNNPRPNPLLQTVFAANPPSSGAALKREMVAFLKKEFRGLVDNINGKDAEFEIEGAIYWFANDYHGGGGSALYQILSSSQFRPGPSVKGPEDEIEQMMYDALEKKYGGKANPHRRKNPPISAQWDGLTRRQREAVLEVVGYDRDYSGGMVRSSWSALSPSAKRKLEAGWLDTSYRSTGETTRRRYAPVGANPLTRREAGQVLRDARFDVRHGSIFQAGHTRSSRAGMAFGKAKVVRQYGPRVARRAANRISDEARKVARTTMSNPGSLRLPRPGTRLTVTQALELARRIGDRGLIVQCEKALKLQKAANRSAKCVIWKTFPMGSPDKIDQVVALTHYGDTPETMYKPPKGSKKGQHMYRHKWGEGGGGKKTVPLLASADGKMLLMPLEGRKVASDWLRH